MKKSPRTVPVSVRLLALAVGAGLASVGLTGCVHEPATFNPRDAQVWERSTDSEVKVRRLGPLPTTAETPYINGPARSGEEPRRDFMSDPMNVPEGPPVQMTLQEIIHRTVANNLDIRVASYDTAIDQTRILEAEANFDPSVFSDISYQHVDKNTAGVDSAVVNPAATTGNPFTSAVTRRDQEDLSSFDLGFRQNLPSGGKAEVKQTITNTWTNPVRGLVNPFYQNDLTLELTQPLLQNYGVAVNRARITIAVNNQRISLLDFRKTLEETILKVEQAYWQLVQAERDLETVKNLIKASEDTTEILRKRLGNDVTAIPLLQSISETYSRKVTLRQLQGHIFDLSDQLKQLMNDPRYPTSGSTVITPSDAGNTEPLHFNLDDQIETAMDNRLELGQQQVRVDSAQIALEVAINNLLPQLNLQATGGVDGLRRHLGPSLESEGQFNRLGYSLGLQFVYPLGNRAARAVWQRAQLQRLQAIVSYGALVKTVTLDVKTAARAVDYAWYRLKDAHAATLSARDLVQKQVIQRPDQAITQESIFVQLQNQQLLASAEQSEHQALNDYNFAIVNLEKAKGTILRYNNVIMEQEQLPAGMSLSASHGAADGPGVDGLHR